MSEEGVGRQYRARGTVKVQPLSLLLLRRIDGSPGSRRRGREG
jgi:hypothetical protein